MASESDCLSLLGGAAIASGIFLGLGGSFGIVFFTRFCVKKWDNEPQMPCYYHNLSFLSALINTVINILTFAYCLWLWILMHNGNDIGYSDQGTHKSYILIEVYSYLWYFTKIFDMFIFNARLNYTFIDTAYALSRWIKYASYIMSFVIIIPVLLNLYLAFMLSPPDPYHYAKMLKVVRVAPVLLYLTDLIITSLVYGHKYRLIVKKQLSIPQFQNEKDTIELTDLTRFSLLTTMVWKGAMFVWICIVIRHIFMAPNGNTETLISAMISMDVFLDTLSILMLYEFGSGFYNVCCMFSSGDEPSKWSFHNMYDCFLRCVCCVPKARQGNVPDGDAYIDI